MILATTEDPSTYRQTFLVCLRGPVSRGAFLQRAKARAGTYAGDLICQLHQAIFEHSVELKSDYSTYFAREYDGFGSYLSRLFTFDYHIVEQLLAAYNTYRFIYRYQRTLYFLEGAYGIDFLTKLIEPAKTGIQQ